MLSRRWSASLPRHALVAGVNGQSRLSKSTVGRSGGVRVPTALVDTFKISNDPQFIDKVRDVVGLYLDPPEKALVLVKSRGVVYDVVV